ncbi:unnamed protein product [Camellia sinensis]
MSLAYFLAGDPKQLIIIGGKQQLTVPVPPAYKRRMLMSYDGWQYQQSPPTIQCIVEKALTQITKQERRDLHLVGTSRTDSGVHAWGQVAHFVTPFNYDRLESIHAALNGLLPSDITKSKVYHYKIYNDTIMDPFQRQYAYHSVYKLNTNVMREAAKHFLGKQDFSAFVNASHNDRSPNPVKNIFRCDVTEMVIVMPNSNVPQVKRVVGFLGFILLALLYEWISSSTIEDLFGSLKLRALVSYIDKCETCGGREAIPPDIVPRILATRDCKALAKYALSAPPHGLCLASVNYNEEHLQLPTACPATSFGRHHSIRKCKLPFF